VWKALLPALPMTALIRNLATLTRIGVLTPKSDWTSKVTARITDRAALRKARIHPIALLAALDAAFSLAFENVEPTGARTLVGLDVSGSMSSGTIAGVPGITPRVGAAAMALSFVRTERDVTVMAFAEDFVPFAIAKDESVASVVRRTEALPFMGTDCSLPILYAMEHRLAIDLFVVLTDNETWAGTIHPDEALRQYRRRSGKLRGDDFARA
jgi:60 kDa SS-A/Ro ribonucleoprotein